MTSNSPDSEIGSIECFQNYTPSEVFIQGLAGIVDQQDVESMIRAQKEMLQRFEKTNEMLTNCNSLVDNRLKTVGAEFKKHRDMLTEMRKDLDSVFKRIRILKSKVENQYPQAYNAVKDKDKSLLSEEDEELAEMKNSVANKNQNVWDDAKAEPPHKHRSLNAKSRNEESNKKTGEDAGEIGEDEAEERRRLIRINSSSSGSANGSSNTDLYQYTSDTDAGEIGEDEAEEGRRLKRVNSSSSDSANGNSNNDSSPYTSDTG